MANNYFDALADMGDMDLGSLEVGAWNPFRRKRRARRGGVPARMLIPRVPGAPSPGIRLQPLGLGATAFTAASGTTLALTAQPQRPFKGQRLVVDITRTGASATGLVTITRLDVGTSNQLVASGPLAAAAFAANAFDVNLQLDPATPGITITVQVAISAAPAGADRVDIAGVLFGTAIG
jgi:hypothetical protein